MGVNLEVENSKADGENPAEKICYLRGCLLIPPHAVEPASTFPPLKVDALLRPGLHPINIPVQDERDRLGARQTLGAETTPAKAMCSLLFSKQKFRI